MSTRLHFLYRIDMWSRDSESVIEHLAGVEDFQVAMATYRAACERWPGMHITLSQGARVIESPVRLKRRGIAYSGLPGRDLTDGGDAEIKVAQRD